MSQPHVTLDPDPLHVAESADDAWEAGHAAAIDDRRGRIVGLVLAALSGAVVGAALMYGIVSAAPRTASEVVVPASPPARSGAPLEDSRAPSTSAALDGQASAGGAPLPDGSSITGIASWYDAGPGLYAAVPSWRWGDAPYRVRVTAGGRAVVVTVGDFCGCPGGRVIDLSADAFARLAPLSQGLVRVTVTRLDAAVTPPPTETER